MDKETVLDALETKMEQMRKEPMESELSVKFRAGYLRAMEYAIELVKMIE